jgi:ATP-binding cassette subfamily B protein
MSILDLFNISLLVPLASKIINNKIPDWIADYNFFQFFYKENYLSVIYIITLFFIKLLIAEKVIKYTSATVFLSKSFLQKQNIRYHLMADYQLHSKKDFSKFLNDCHLNIMVFTDNFILQLINLVSDLLILLFIIAVILIININFFIFIVVLLLITLIINKNFLQKSLNKIGKLRSDADNKITRIFKDVFNDFRSIKFNNFEDKIIFNIDKDINLSNKFYGKRYQKTQIVKYINEFLIVALLLALILFFNLFSKNILDEMLFGIIFLFRMLPVKNKILSSIQAINYSNYVVTDFLKNFQSISKINKKEELNYSQNNFNFNEITKIEFKNVFFSYDLSNIILKNINISFQKGSQVLIKGISGSGKSTLVDLLSGLLFPTKGQIMANDKNIFELRRQYRDRLSYVSQNSYFIDATILENLELFSKDKINMIFLDEVLKITNCSFINDLPNKLNTQLNINAAQLSGGQKQRLAIARALLKDFDFLILDEATNALDINNEREILQNIKTKFGDKGIIIVSHSSYLDDKRHEILEIVDKKLQKIID